MIETDALVIGAGPVGLFQVFQLGLLGLKVEAIDVLPHPGGQCMALYADKPIYDVPGVPVCTGRELTELLLRQASPFLPVDAASGLRQHLHLGHLVSSLQADGAHWLVGTDHGLQVRARAVFVAAGAGAFVPRGLGVAELDGALNLHHHLPDPAQAVTHAPPWAGRHLVVAGGGDEALSAVIALANPSVAAHRPALLTLLHRREQFQAEPHLEAAVRQLIDRGEIAFEVGLPQGADRLDGAPGHTVQALHLLGADSQTRRLAFDHIMVRLGLSPKLGPLTQWGMDLERKQVAVSPARFTSSLPGIYAVGDINTYPGKKRLLLCGFHEATLAAHDAVVALNPDAPPHLLYTTTSPVLHQRLGV